MRLLGTKTGHLQEFLDPSKRPPYAILSHVWQTDEQKFQDVSGLREFPDALERLSPKIRNACYFAAREGLEWIWIDTCCIDKSSSSELSEAINSMYAWYAGATVCYAWLHDVEDTHPSKDDLPESFRHSVWHIRGWTLQELLAPRYVVFLSKRWHTLGTKQSLAKMIEDVTGIDYDVLMFNVELYQISVARRMSWAADRKTTRIEDRAYSLLGIFEIHMSTIYGEGSNAFVRLQHEILKQTPDQTLFAWAPEDNMYVDFSDLSTAIPVGIQRDMEIVDSVSRTLLASSPGDFRCSSDVSRISLEDLGDRIGYPDILPHDYIHTGHGMRTSLPFYQTTFRDPVILVAILACQDESGNLLALFLNQTRRTSGEYYSYQVGADIAVNSADVRGPAAPHYFRICRLSTRDLATLRGNIVQQDLYIKYHLTRVHNTLYRRLTLREESFAQGVSYGFFFPAWLFQPNGFSFLSDGSMPEDDEDGHMIELRPGRHPERTVVFARRGPQPWPSPVQPQGCRFTVALGCGCGGSPLQHNVTLSLDMIYDPNPQGQTHGGPYPSLSAILENDSNVRRMMLQTTSLRSRAPSVHESPHPGGERGRMRGGSISTSSASQAGKFDRSQSPSSGIRQCPFNRAHIPTTAHPSLSLRWLSEVGMVDVSLKKWDGCRKSSATYVYIVDIGMLPLGDHREPERKSSLPVTTQGVIPESGLIVYRAAQGKHDNVSQSRGLFEGHSGQFGEEESIEIVVEGPSLDEESHTFSPSLSQPSTPPPRTIRAAGPEPEPGSFRSHSRRYSSPSIDACSPATTFYSVQSSPAPRSRHASISTSGSPHDNRNSRQYLTPASVTSQFPSFDSPNSSHASLSPQLPPLPISVNSSAEDLSRSHIRLLGVSPEPHGSSHIASPSPNSPHASLSLTQRSVVSYMTSPRPPYAQLPTVDSDSPPPHSPPPLPRMGVSALPSPSELRYPTDRGHYSAPRGVLPPMVPPESSMLLAPQPIPRSERLTRSVTRWMSGHHNDIGGT